MFNNGLKKKDYVNIYVIERILYFSNYDILLIKNYFCRICRKLL